MERQKIGASGDALRSISGSVTMKAAGGASLLSFKEYLRFVDMGVGRKHPLGGLKETIVSLKAQDKEGIAFAKDNVRRPKKVYSKTAYGNLTTLYNRLLYGFTEETVAMLKKEIEQKNVNI